MQRIIPNIWCNGTADEAVAFYVDAFPEATAGYSYTYPEEGLPDFQRDMAGKTLGANVDIDGYTITLINAGDEFSPTPAISFFVNFDPSVRDDARADLDRLWAKLTDGGHVLMELGAYPHSEHYGWVADRFGVNWQLMLTDPTGDSRPMIIPNLMFCGPAQNKAAEAADHYLSVFPDSRLAHRVPYGQATGRVTPESVVFSDFQLYGEWLSAMDSAVDQPFTFTEGLSLSVNCRDQAEIDRIWEALSAVPESEVCGWCKDSWGVNWQIVPENMDELMTRPGAYETMMGMSRIVIDRL